MFVEQGSRNFHVLRTIAELEQYWRERVHQLHPDNADRDPLLPLLVVGVRQVRISHPYP